MDEFTLPYQVYSVPCIGVAVVTSTRLHGRIRLVRGWSFDKVGGGDLIDVESEYFFPRLPKTKYFFLDFGVNIFSDISFTLSCDLLKLYKTYNVEIVNHNITKIPV